MEDNPEGTLSKEKMMEMYSEVLSYSKALIFVEQIFAKFDTDNNGNIDFKVKMMKMFSVKVKELIKGVYAGNEHY